jgi:hypothetical protein
LDGRRLVVFLLEEDDDIKAVREKAGCFGGIVQVLGRNNDLVYYLREAGVGRRGWRGRVYRVVLMPGGVSVSSDARLIAEYARGVKVIPKSLDVFVLAQSEWDKEKVEDIAQSGGPCAFHIMDELDLLIRQMVEEHPPYMCPGLNFSGGVAARNFNVMVLGFGLVGQRALLKLIMNGQFVGSRMQAVVIDREMEHLEEHFRYCYPAIDLCCDIKFENADVRDKDFFRLLNSESVDDIDYIVIALGDDGESKRMATDIRLHYRRGGVGNIPFIAVFEKDGSVPDVEQDDKTFTFGCLDSVYTDAIIIRDEANRMARAIHRVYGDDPPWDRLDWVLHESNRASADFIPAMLKLAGLDEGGARGKEALVEKGDPLAEVLAQTEHLRWMAFHAAMGFRPISIGEMVSRFEGYKGEDAKARLNYCRRDSKARLQVTLVDWDELDEVSEAYRELARKTDVASQHTRDFKDVDREITKSVPEFLRSAEGGG